MPGKRYPSGASHGSGQEQGAQSQGPANDYGSNQALQTRLHTKRVGPGMVGGVPSPKDPILANLAEQLRPHNGLVSEDEAAIDRVVQNFISQNQGMPIDISESIDLIAWVHRAQRGTMYNSSADLEAMIQHSPDSPTQDTPTSAGEMSIMATHLGTAAGMLEVICDAADPKIAQSARTVTSQLKALAGFVGHAANVAGMAFAGMDFKEQAAKLDALWKAGDMEGYAKQSEAFWGSFAGFALAAGLTGAALISGGPLITGLGLLNGLLTILDPNWLTKLVNSEDIGDVIARKIEEHGNPNEHHITNDPRLANDARWKAINSNIPGKQ